MYFSNAHGVEFTSEEKQAIADLKNCLYSSKKREFERKSSEFKKEYYSRMDRYYSVSDKIDTVLWRSFIVAIITLTIVLIALVINYGVIEESWISFLVFSVPLLFCFSLGVNTIVFVIAGMIIESTKLKIYRKIMGDYDDHDSYDFRTGNQVC